MGATRIGLALASASVLGCGGEVARPGDAFDPASTSSTTLGEASTAGTSADASTLPGDVDGSGDEGPSESSSGGPPSLPPSQLLRLAFHCKLINGSSVTDPSANQTHTRFNLRATDLGIPLVVGDRLHVFFGDTHGHREIWAIGEDPDSVGFVDAAAAAADPSVLCDQLEFLVTPDVPSVAADTDPAVLRDFAAGWMTPPAGEDVSAYVGLHPGPFPNIPGSFEVPAGAVAIGEHVYLFWAGKSELEPYARMTLGYLARWDPPRELPVYQIVRPVDSRYDRMLGGQFIQVQPFVDGDTLYLLGTGEYRRSGIHLARLPVAAIESGAGTELWDPTSRAWREPGTLTPDERESIAPVVETEGVGELGGVFVPGPDLWLLMYQQAHWDGATLLSNRVVVRTAPDPTGPWSEQLVIIDMADPAFVLQHCCLAEPCLGEQIWQCNSAGLYGAYPLPNPHVEPQGDGTFAVDLPFLVSTWMPYNVVLFEARLLLAPS